MGHFVVKKTENVLERYVSQCTTCNKDKSRLNPHGLCTPLPVPSVP
jgi:hypothetical protein